LACIFAPWFPDLGSTSRGPNFLAQGTEGNA
jgi:hypothetical protein